MFVVAVQTAVVFVVVVQNAAVAQTVDPRHFVVAAVVTQHSVVVVVDHLDQPLKSFATVVDYYSTISVHYDHHRLAVVAPLPSVVAPATFSAVANPIGYQHSYDAPVVQLLVVDFASIPAVKLLTVYVDRVVVVLVKIPLVVAVVA